MKVVIDTNVLVKRHFQLTGPHITILERAIALGAIELVVPEIVVEETCNKYRETVEKMYRKAEGCISELNKVMMLSKDISLPPVDVQKIVKEFVSAFEARLKELKASRPTYTDIPQGLLVKRDLLRRRPFLESGRGYRDTLLWETIVQKAVGKKEKVFLVTEDAKNFWQDDKTCVLHSHLADDVQALGLPADAVSLISPLEAFIDQYLKPLLPTNKEVLAAIKSGAYALFDFAKFFDSNRTEIGKEIQVAGLRQLLSELPTDVEEVEVRYLEDPKSADTTSAHEVGKDKLFLSYDVIADVSLDFFLFKSDYYAMEETDFSVEDANWNDHYMWCSKTVTVPFQISLVLELGIGPQDEVESWDLEVQEFYGWCWQCGVPILNDAAETCPECKANLLRPKKRMRRGRT